MKGRQVHKLTKPYTNYETNFIDDESYEDGIDFSCSLGAIKHKFKNSKSIPKMNWEELTNYRKIKGHKQPWLWRQLWTRGKEEEIKQYAAKCASNHAGT